MNEKKNKHKLPDNFDAVDPLGEIRSCARDLWNQDGAPADKDWTHYWSQAEKLTLGGKSSGAPSGRVKVAASPRQDRPLSSSLQEILENEDELLPSLLAGAFRRALNDHECLCLARILETYSFKLTGGRNLPASTPDEISAALALLAGEYDSDFLSAYSSLNLLTIPVQQRTRYWAKKCQKMREEDNALSFADRNTVHRLLDELKHEPRVQELVFVAEPSQLA
jgi:hypothetical protein